MNNKFLGGIGEKAAAEYLESQGYRIIERNYKCKLGEIDIIAADKDTVVFVEVKTRSSNTFGQPGEAVNYHKQKKIVRTALSYISNKKLFNWMSRFDVVEVITDNDRIIDINLIRDAFQYIGKYGY